MELKLAKKVLASLTALGIAAGPALAAGEVNVLTWEGYADASFIKKFEEDSGCKVTATYVGSNDDFAPKLAAGGGVYDLITPSIDTTKTMIDAGFVEGRDVRWGTRHRLALVSVNRYRDADAAKDVLTAHLTALCGEATSVEVRDDRAGLTIVRESDTVRTVFVLDDVEVSVMICHCYGSDNDSRRAIIDGTKARVTASKPWTFTAS